jgi:hypothetical protein
LSKQALRQHYRKLSRRAPATGAASVRSAAPGKSGKDNVKTRRCSDGSKGAARLPYDLSK